MTGTETAREYGSSSGEVRVSEAGQQWARRWRNRLEESVSLRLHDEPDDLAPEETSEQTVRHELAEGARILGWGLDRIVVVPPTSVSPTGVMNDDGKGNSQSFVNGWERDVSEVVLKLPRPTEPGCEGGFKQNKAETRVWDALEEGELYRFDTVSGTQEQIDVELFAPVLDTADDGGWLLMPYFEVLPDVAPTEKEDVLARMEGEFLEATIRPDLDPTNIGVRDDGRSVIIDYGMPNWVGEEGLW